MLINQAFAQDAGQAAPATDSATSTATALPAAAATAPSQTEVMLWNIGFVAVLVLMFYFLLIRPQQMRYREHNTMMQQLKKGDKVVLQSGMIGTIEHIGAADEQEVTVAFVDGVKAHVLRSAIAGKYADIVTSNNKK